MASSASFSPVDFLRGDDAIAILLGIAEFQRIGGLHAGPEFLRAAFIEQEPAGACAPRCNGGGRTWGRPSGCARAPADTARCRNRRTFPTRLRAPNPCRRGCCARVRGFMIFCSQFIASPSGSIVSVRRLTNDPKRPSVVRVKCRSCQCASSAARIGARKRVRPRGDVPPHPWRRPAARPARCRSPPHRQNRRSPWHFAHRGRRNRPPPAPSHEPGYPPRARRYRRYSSARTGDASERHIVQETLGRLAQLRHTRGCGGRRREQDLLQPGVAQRLQHAASSSGQSTSSTPSTPAARLRWRSARSRGSRPD
jgi:hypothetical protein